MKFRIRGPTGQSTVTLDDEATVDELRTQIIEKTGLTAYDVKYGYPDLKSLEIDGSQPGARITGLANINGELLIVTRKERTSELLQSEEGQKHASSPPALSQSQPSEHLSSEDSPEIASFEHSGTFVLRVMPDDNSCLFRAVGSALMGGMDIMSELRSVVAQTIQDNPDTYTEAVLEKRPDDYCRWIQNENSWGGGIELSILSKHFDIEIRSIDVQTLRIDRFNEGRPMCCILVYSGIHYDTIALSPSEPPFTHANAPPEFDTKIFDSSDSLVLEKSLELCKILQGKHYYTNTAGFLVRCNTCGGTFVGEKGATKHATETGHYDFGEAE